jgi:hypothetical protein
MFVFVTDEQGIEPRLVVGDSVSVMTIEGPGERYAPLFGMDIDHVGAGTPIVMSGTAVQGYPFNTLDELPDGNYQIQAVFQRYTDFRRADGHEVWAHKDQWEGQQPHISPGNLYSAPVALRVGRGEPFAAHLTITNTIPAIPLSPDTKFVKRLRFKSALASEFWGSDMEVGAVVQLPNGYFDHPDKQYPVLYAQGHFFEADEFVVPDKRPEAPPDVPKDALRDIAREQERFDHWAASDAPQLIIVTFQHPTPFYDSSYLVNSPVAGPYGDVLMQELIPRIESEFRVIKQPWARVLTGGSIGGWTSAALQIFHPDFFGGTWSACPDPVDFHSFYGIDLYDDDNAFVVPDQHWVKTDRVFVRRVTGTPLNTMRRVSQLHRALGSRGRSGELYDNFSSSFGPLGPDGYPRLIWDHTTGRIDHDVAEYWRDHGFDLNVYIAKHWPTIGKQLAGKLRFFCGEADNFGLNQPMYALQKTLESMKNPSYGGWFYYARPNIGHQHVYPNDVLLKDMLRVIAGNAPRGTNIGYLHVPRRSTPPLRGNVSAEQAAK